MKPNPPLHCVSCGVRIPNRADRQGRWCKPCFNKNRCAACGQIVPPGRVHACNGIDARPPRHCRVCGKVLSNQGSERHRKICGPCAKAAFRERERAERRRLREMFGNACQRCGYDRCAAALHFHHADRAEKYLWNRTGKGGASIREIKAHPGRFLLLCANCHIEEHQGSAALSPAA